jgi:hypothetical protein
MKELAIITILFDYPCSYQAVFENKLFIDFDKNDYYKLCYDTNEYGVKSESLYYKFTRFRITEMIKFVENNILGKYKYCMLLDATDIGYVGGIDNYKDILKAYNTEMLFGAETNLWPGTDFSHLYKNKNRGKFNFLNAGTLLANVDLYYNLMKKVNEVIQQYDVIICPSRGDGNQSAITNLTGHPVVCIPTGFDKKFNLPTGISFVGNLYDVVVGRFIYC